MTGTNHDKKQDCHKNADIYASPAGLWVGPTDIRTLLASEDATEVDAITVHSLFAVHALPKAELPRHGRLAEGGFDNLTAEPTDFVLSRRSRGQLKALA